MCLVLSAIQVVKANKYPKKGGESQLQSLREWRANELWPKRAPFAALGRSATRFGLRGADRREGLADRWLARDLLTAGITIEMPVFVSGAITRIQCDVLLDVPGLIAAAIQHA